MGEEEVLAGLGGPSTGASGAAGAAAGAVEEAAHTITDHPSQISPEGAPSSTAVDPAEGGEACSDEEGLGTDAHVHRWGVHADRADTEAKAAKGKGKRTSSTELASDSKRGRPSTYSVPALCCQAVLVVLIGLAALPRSTVDHPELTIVFRFQLPKRFVHNHDPESSEDQSVVRRLPTTATLAYLEEVRVMRVMQSLQKIVACPSPSFHFQVHTNARPFVMSMPVLQLMCDHPTTNDVAVRRAKEQAKKAHGSKGKDFDKQFRFYLHGRKGKCCAPKWALAFRGAIQGYASVPLLRCRVGHASVFP